MQAPLVARLVQASRYQISLRPGRTGWSLTSPLPHSWIRARLRRWADRVTPLHRESGRFFVRPNKIYLSHTLSTVTVPFKEGFHDCPVRRERLRRLRALVSLQPSEFQPLANRHFLSLALRLEATGFKSDPDPLWRHISKDFDKLWAEVPLFALGFEPWQRQVLDLLSKPVSSNLYVGKGS